LHDFSRRIACSPVVPSTDALLSNEEVLRIVDILIGACLDPIDDLVQMTLADTPGSKALSRRGTLTLGSKSSRMARGIYRVSSLYIIFSQSRAIEQSANIANLIEEDVLPIPTLCREVFQIPILTDTMFLTELLPELATNFICPLLSVHDVPTVDGDGEGVPLLPHWPAWMVIISL